MTPARSANGAARGSRATPDRDALLTIGRQPLVAAVRRALRTECAIAAGARVVVAVSGGADSLALLLALAAMAHRSRRSGAPSPIAVHVDHRLRAESAADARFVRREATRVGIPVEIVEIDVAEARRRRSENLEAAARRLRYDALRDAALRHGCSAIVTAHHADDQLETIIMNLCRGCGPTALAGMPWRRPLLADEPDGIALVRPLLGSSRAECRALCRVAGRRWRHDATNDDVARTRARLRAEVLPVLDDLWPGCAVRASKAADLLRELCSPG